jgi:hypothetical protein
MPAEPTNASTDKAPEGKKVGSHGYSVDVALAKTNSFLTQSKFFKKCVKDAFHEVDMNGNKELDQAEVYCAILLLYTKLLYVPFPFLECILRRC